MKTLLLLFLLPLVALLAPLARAEEPAPAGVTAEKHLNAEEAEKLIKAKKDLVILDVRTPEEYAEAHIKGAKNLDYHGADFAQQLAALDKSKEYLVHCAAGGRSTQCVKKMKQQNFTAIYHLDGGLNAWTAAGKPVEKSQ